MAIPCFFFVYTKPEEFVGIACIIIQMHFLVDAGIKRIRKLESEMHIACSSYNKEMDFSFECQLKCL